jgi:hypothetical protein
MDTGAIIHAAFEHHEIHAALGTDLGDHVQLYHAAAGIVHELKSEFVRGIGFDGGGKASRIGSTN